MAHESSSDIEQQSSLDEQPSRGIAGRIAGDPGVKVYAYSNRLRRILVVVAGGAERLNFAISGRQLTATPVRAARRCRGRGDRGALSASA